jgi:hypothetical protein
MTREHHEKQSFFATTEDWARRTTFEVAHSRVFDWKLGTAKRLLSLSSSQRGTINAAPTFGATLEAFSHQANPGVTSA